MSQDVNPTMNTLEVDAIRPGDRRTDEIQAKDSSVTETLTPQPTLQTGVFSAEQYASQLMDDLFHDLEHSLETGEPLEIRPEKPAIAVEILNPGPENSALSVIEPTESSPEANPEAISEPSSTALGTATAEQQSEAVAAAVAKPDWSLRILWAAALLSCATALTVGITQGDSYRALFTQITTGEAGLSSGAAIQTATAEAPNQAFANYIQQSLDALAVQPSPSGLVESVAAAPGLATTPTGGPTTVTITAPTALPALPPSAIATAPGGQATAPQTGSNPQPTTILERIYIPVYQTPQGLVPVVPGVELPSWIASAGANPLANSSPAPAANPAPAQTAAAPSNQPSPSAPAPASDLAVQPMAIDSHTLVGLLELGDGSAALFEVAGVTRRFSLGERIGSSGWTLVEVKNSEAIVRRNGELRSIFVGQRF